MERGWGEMDGAVENHVLGGTMLGWWKPPAKVRKRGNSTKGRKAVSKTEGMDSRGLREVALSGTKIYLFRGCGGWGGHTQAWRVAAS